MLLGLVTIWIACVVSLALFVRSRKSLHLSLGLAYLFSLTFFHLLGALIYLSPSYDPAEDLYLKAKGTTALQTIAGFQVAVQYAVVFCIAYSFFVLLMFNNKSSFLIDLKSILDRPQVKRLLRARLLGLFRIISAISLLFYLIFFILKLINIPSISLVFSQGPVMLIASVMVAEFLFSLGAELYLLVGALALLILFIQGFLGYSIRYIVMMTGLLVSYKTIKKVYFLYGTAVAAVGAGALKSWLISREIIREILFDNGSLSLDVIQEFLRKFIQEFFSSFLSGYSSTFVAIDTRINLNNILGRVVLNWTPDIAIDSIQQMYIAFIPRLIWPNKPPLEESTQWVRDLTNISISKGTSVGLGNISELYGNFGELGILLGAVVIALMFAVLDYQMNLSLYKMFFLRAWGLLLVGLTLIHPGGIFVKIANSTVVSLVVYLLIIFFLKNVFPQKLKTARPQSLRPE